MYRQACHGVYAKVRPKESIFSCTTWVLGIEFTSPDMAVYAFTHWAISPGTGSFLNQDWIEVSKGSWSLVKEACVNRTKQRGRCEARIFSPCPGFPLTGQFPPQRGARGRKLAFCLVLFYYSRKPDDLCDSWTAAFRGKGRGQKAHLGVSWTVSCPHFYFEVFVPKDLRIRPYLETGLLKEQSIKTGQSWRRMSPSSTITEVLIKRSSLGNSRQESAPT